MKPLLLTTGDSFTYGEELEHPELHAWPVLVAQELGYDLVNKGNPGTGNELQIKHVLKNVPTLKPDLVIVAWTSPGRIEIGDEEGVYDVWPGSNLGKWTNGTANFRVELSKYMTLHNNEEWQYRRWLRQIIQLQSYLKLNDINYRFVMTFNDNTDLNKKLLHRAYDYVDQIDKSQFIGWPNVSFVNWCWREPHGPNRHPLEAGHQKIAENIIEALRTTR
jgi:hypothetical protein